MAIDKTKIELPKWVLRLAQHRTKNGFHDIFNEIRDQYNNAYEPYRFLEEIHIKTLY